MRFVFSSALQFKSQPLDGCGQVIKLLSQFPDLSFILFCILGQHQHLPDEFKELFPQASRLS